MRVQDLESIRIILASPDRILEWSHGEVTKPETINYRNQRPEKDGLFARRYSGQRKIMSVIVLSIARYDTRESSVTDVGLR